MFINLKWDEKSYNATTEYCSTCKECVLCRPTYEGDCLYSKVDFVRVVHYKNFVDFLSKELDGNTFIVARMLGVSLEKLNDYKIKVCKELDNSYFGLLDFEDFMYIIDTELSKKNLTEFEYETIKSSKHLELVKSLRNDNLLSNIVQAISLSDAEIESYLVKLSNDYGVEIR